MLAFVLFGLYGLKAQVYTGAAGLGIEFGDGATLVGPSGKYFFSEHSSGQVELLFDDGVTAINLFYIHASEFSGSNGLQWYLGVGPTFLLVDGGSSDVGIRPLVGLDYKINNVPLGFTADWRPYFSLDSGSEAGIFAIGVRYIFD